MLIVVALLTLIRVLYIFLVVIGVFVDNNYSALSFIFIELPSFLYFTTMTFFVVVWYDFLVYSVLLLIQFHS